jgi:hypothetical protein
MNGILTTNFRAAPDVFDVYFAKLEIALRELRVRLQARYERRFPGEGMRIREALSRAEVVAWHTDFPHLFLPDLAEEAIERLSFFLEPGDKDECNSLADVASGVRCACE